MKLKQINPKDIGNEHMSINLSRFLANNNDISCFEILEFTKNDLTNIKYAKKDNIGVAWGAATILIATTEPNARAKIIMFLSELE